MRAILLAIILTMPAAACNKPIAANAPKPNPSTVAGVAGAAAAAMTLLDPDGAARQQEENKPTEEKREQASKGNVPADVLDRLDSKETQPSASKPTEGEEAAPDPYGLAKKKAAPPAKPKKEPTVFTPQK